MISSANSWCLCFDLRQRSYILDNMREPTREYIFPQSPEGQNSVVMDILELPVYELEDDKMRIHDVVWGDCEIGDRQPYDSLLMELARSPLFRRLQAVEQLTLPPRFATLPNTTYFSRWQHVWGSLAFVRKMTEGDERFDDRQRTVLELRTLFSDVGQTAFSHLGDWMFQGIQGGENLHDQDLRELLETFGVDALLEKYGLTLDETVFPEVDDWVECPSPDLCVDRVDYGLREILRWSGRATDIASYQQNLQNPQSLFRINDQQMLEVTNEDFARRFAAGYSILPTEHWIQPVHRLQLELLQTAVKRALLESYFSDGVSLTYPVHPRDRIYGIDADYRFALAAVGDGGALSRTMQTIASDQRQIYVAARRLDLCRLFSDVAMSFPDFPDPLQSYCRRSKEFGLVLPHVEIVQNDKARQGILNEMGRVSLGLPPMKPRSIDPSVLVDGQAVKLSKIDPSFGNYLAGQNEAMRRGYQAELLVNREFGRKLLDLCQRVNDDWPDAVRCQRNPDNLREIVRQAGMCGAGRRFDGIYEL